VRDATFPTLLLLMPQVVGAQVAVTLSVYFDPELATFSLIETPHTQKGDRPRRLAIFCRHRRSLHIHADSIVRMGTEGVCRNG
jgi:hypothetical protein